MKGGTFNSPECCVRPCECPVCLETKILMRLNCNHYVCLDDIQRIINSNSRKLQKCPICRVLITNYGCNGNIVNVDNNQNEQPSEEEETVTVYDSDYEYEDDDRPMYRNYGGKIKKNYTRKNINTQKRKTRRKKTKRKISKRRRFK